MCVWERRRGRLTAKNETELLILVFDTMEEASVFENRRETLGFMSVTNEHVKWRAYVKTIDCLIWVTNLIRDEHVVWFGGKIKTPNQAS